MNYWVKQLIFVGLLSLLLAMPASAGTWRDTTVSQAWFTPTPELKVKIANGKSYAFDTNAGYMTSNQFLSVILTAISTGKPISLYHTTPGKVGSVMLKSQ